MQVSAINNSVNFERKSHKKNHQPYTPVNTNPHKHKRKTVDLNNQPSYRPVNLNNVDKNMQRYYDNDEGTFQYNPQPNRANGMRRLATAAMIAGAMTAGGAALQSCEQDPSIIEINNNINHKHILQFYVINPKPDTIVIRDTITNEVIDTVYINKTDTVFLKKGLNPIVGDSIYDHLDTLGTKPKGEGNIPISIMMYDEYMMTSHKMKLDGEASTDEQLVMIDERSDYSETDSENPDPKVSFVRVKASVLEGKGVYFQYEKLRPGVDPNKKKFEPGDWKFSGESVETNHGNKITIQKFDQNGKLVKTGEYLKGDKNVSIFFDRLLDTDPSETVRRRYTQVSSQWTTGDEYANRYNPVVEREVEKED